MEKQTSNPPTLKASAWQAPTCLAVAGQDFSEPRTMVSEFWLSLATAIYKIDIMKLTKNIGMLLLAVYLIVDGLLGFGLNIGPAIFLLYILALAAGIFILIGK
jgi:hypothetical protein